MKMKNLHIEQMNMERAYEESPIRTAACFSKGKIQFEQPSQANGNKLVLRDTRIVEQGEAKGHGVFMERKFLGKLIELAEGRRIKARMGHPDMCTDSFGKLVGHYENHRLVETENETFVIADLHLSTAAMKSPHGNITEYVQAIAEEYPDMFGNSIVFYTDYLYYKTDKGHELRRDWHTNANTDGWSVYKEDGSRTAYEPKEHGEFIDQAYIMPKSYEATDLVDEPAATSDFFSEKTLVGRLLSAIGFETANMRKVLQLKSLINTINNMKYSINAVTTDGTELIIETERDSIRVGDSVTVGGEPAPDGAHDIDTADSGESGITITTESGTITSIVHTQPAMEYANPDEVEQSNASDAAQLAALQAQNTALQAQINALKAENETLKTKLSALPMARPSKVNPAADTRKPEKSTRVPAYQQSVIDQYNKRFKK
jgi:regulator of replication initiation timing